LLWRRGSSGRRRKRGLSGVTRGVGSSVSGVGSSTGSSSVSGGSRLGGGHCTLGGFGVGGSGGEGSPALNHELQTCNAASEERRGGRQRHELKQG
jgi:hypothetical protein